MNAIRMQRKDTEKHMPPKPGLHPHPAPPPPLRPEECEWQEPAHGHPHHEPETPPAPQRSAA